MGLCGPPLFDHTNDFVIARVYTRLKKKKKKFNVTDNFKHFCSSVHQILLNNKHFINFTVSLGFSGKIWSTILKGVIVCFCRCYPLGGQLHQSDGSDRRSGHAELQPEGDRMFQRGVADPLHDLCTCGWAPGGQRRKPRASVLQHTQRVCGDRGGKVRHLLYFLEHHIE